jgi:hypothetical protein
MDQEQSPEMDVPNLGPLLNRTIWLLASIAALFLGLRIYSKVSRGRSLWWDDHFLVASFVSFRMPMLILFFLEKDTETGL